VSLITLMSMLKIWAGPFWGETKPIGLDNIALAELDPPPGRGGAATVVAPTRVRASLIAPALTLTGVTLFLGLAGQWLLGLSGQGADGLLRLTTYLAAVNGL